jgi:DNA replication licensing factor MCM6
MKVHGHLVAISGTVTRTSEVRPELLFGSFRCHDCSGVIRDVEQEFKFSEVTRYVNLLIANYMPESYLWKYDRL